RTSRFCAVGNLVGLGGSATGPSSWLVIGTRPRPLKSVTPVAGEELRLSGFAGFLTWWLRIPGIRPGESWRDWNEQSFSQSGCDGATGAAGEVFIPSFHSQSHAGMAWVLIAIDDFVHLKRGFSILGGRRVSRGDRES